MAFIIFRQRNLYLTLILIFTLILTTVLMNHTLRPAFFTRPAPSKDSPDSFMKNIHYAQFNEQGELSNQLNANSITHFANSDTAIINQPYLIYYTEAGYHWTIAGDYANSQHSLQEIDVRDNVKIEKINQKTHQVEMTITTSQASAYPKKKYAFTDAPVTITQLDSVVNSVGMTVDLATGEVKLLSDAKGVYQNEKK